MLSWRFRLLLFVAAFFSVFGWLAFAAQGQDVPTRKLRLLQQIPVRLPPSMTSLPGPAQCDNDGALYFRAAQAGSTIAAVAPVVKVSSTGYLSQTFSLSSVPRYDLSTTASISDFAVTSDGQVYMLASKASINGPDPELSILHFSAGGRYLSKLELKHYFLPRRLAIFPGGSYFLLALDQDLYLAAQKRKISEASFVYPVGVFFGLKGKLLREIALPNTAMPPVVTEAANGGDPAAGDDPAFVASSYDGAIYVTRHKPAYSFYVITDSGATVDSITVDPPFPHATIVGIAPDGPNKLVIEFARPADTAAASESREVFSVVGALSGVRLFDYPSTPETSGVLGCTTPVGFELLSRQADGKLLIRFVSGKPRVKAAKPRAKPSATP